MLPSSAAHYLNFAQAHNNSNGIISPRAVTIALPRSECAHFSSRASAIAGNCVSPRAKTAADSPSLNKSPYLANPSVSADFAVPITFSIRTCFALLHDIQFRHRQCKPKD